MTDNARNAKSWIFFGTLLLSAFALNWVWEIAQMKAYAPHGTSTEAMWRCTRATFADAAITLGLYAIGALAAKRLYWGLRGGWNVYLTCAVLGFIHAVLVEKQAIASGRWSYLPQMPIIPLLEVGVWPVLQLTLLVPLAVWIASYTAGRESNDHKMNVISAVLDKSVVHPIAKEQPERQVQIWNHLHRQYQVVVPTILIEEVIVNVAAPGRQSPLVVQEMMKSLLRIQPCWMDDVFEIAFRELVLQQSVEKLPAFPSEYMNRILHLKPDDPELLKWLEERKASRESTVQTRISAQDKLLPQDERREMDDEMEFWTRLKNQFLSIVQNPERRMELLEVVFGETFRERHPDSIDAINAAFARFTEKTFTQYFVTLATLMVRLAYVYAPLVHFKNGPGNTVRRFIGRGASAQRNNAADEQYIVAAMICNRLLTRDEGMKNIIEMFRLGGFTKCQTNYLDPNSGITDQLLQLKEPGE